jgi:protein-S-isoprenylcysteine O-methyltransferase Ste14
MNKFAGLTQIVPLVYIFTPWLDFADFRISLWFSLLGVLLFISALWLLGKAHSPKRYNFSPRMEIGDGQMLVSRGIYNYIRFSTYAGFWLWGIAQPLLLHNWIAGFAMLAIFLPLYIVRVPGEEQMLLIHFGEAYRKDSDQTRRIFPRLKPGIQATVGAEGENVKGLKINRGN